MNVLQATLSGKSLKIELTDAASRLLANRTAPILAEMELYFSCLIRLKVRFYENPDLTNTVKVADNLNIKFRPIMTAQCDTHYAGSEPPVTDFPITKPDAFIPHWLKIDCRHGKFVGNFGYNSQP